MCVGIPAKVVELGEPDSHTAITEVEGVRREVNMLLLEDPADPVVVGDWVLLHVGFAMSKIDEAEARRTLELIREIESVFDDEIDAFGTPPP